MLHIPDLAVIAAGLFVFGLLGWTVPDFAKRIVESER